MKAILIAALAFSAWALSESGTGSTAVTPSSAKFNQPRILNEFASEDPTMPARVVTWNIDRGGSLPEIGDALRRNPAALCLLQEVDLGTRRAHGQDETAELARTLKLNAAFGIEFEELSQEESGQSAYIGQATLTRLPIRKARVLRFVRQSGFWQPHSWLPTSLPLMQRRLGSRIALVTELEFGSNLLVVYNAHLESRSAGPIQAAQLDEMLADAARYPPDTAVLLGGDLNTKYVPSLFLRKLERAGYHSATGEKIERTHTIAMALDWLFAKGPLILTAGTVRRDLKGSDHYPIYAQLGASPAAAPSSGGARRTK